MNQRQWHFRTLPQLLTEDFDDIAEAEAIYIQSARNNGHIDVESVFPWRPSDAKLPNSEKTKMKKA